MSLAKALFAPAQSKIIEWIFGMPARAFHLNELMRLTGLGSASVQREIGRLFEAGLVTDVVKGVKGASVKLHTASRDRRPRALPAAAMSLPGRTRGRASRRSPVTRAILVMNLLLPSG